MKTLTIAFATAKEAIRQPAFFVLAFLAGASLIYTIFVPYFTFGEDIKMYKDTGLTTISFAGLLLALLTASSSVAEEIEGKTAITLLSKPITRRQFILGKYLGIELGVLALFLILGALFAMGVWFKVEYDAREMATKLEEGSLRSPRSSRFCRAWCLASWRSPSSPRSASPSRPACPCSSTWSS